MCPVYCTRLKAIQFKRVDLEAGFSLMEMALALIVCGLMSSVVFPLLKQWQITQVIHRTKQNQENVLYALSAFLGAKGRLPCPAEDSTSGQERARCQKPSTAQGAIPFMTLGLPESVVRDGQNRLLTYVVHPELTVSPTLRTYCQQKLRPLIHLNVPGSDLSFDPLAVLLVSPSKKSDLVGWIDGVPIYGQKTQMRWETRSHLAAFYGRIFCQERVSSEGEKYQDRS